MSTRQHPLPPEQYRDTDPLAVWGFVTALLLWPVGLVLSYVALRRIRRSGDGGWGLAVAGAAISTILAVAFLVGGTILFARSGQLAAWQQEGENRSHANAVRSVTQDVSKDVTRYWSENGEWPQSLRSIADEIDMDDEGAVRDVHVTAFRSGDDLCVEGTREAPQRFLGSVVNGQYEAGTSCDDRGYQLRLRQAAGAEEREAEEVVREETLAAVEERGAETAAASTTTTPPDLGVLSQPTVDLQACALLEGNLVHLDERVTREVVAERFAELAAALPEEDLSSAAYDLAQEPDPAEDDLGAYWLGVLRAQFDCWRGGFVGPSGAPQFPDDWTTPRTPASVAEQEALREAYLDGDEEATELLRERTEATRAQEKPLVEELAAAAEASP